MTAPPTQLAKSPSSANDGRDSDGPKRGTVRRFLPFLRPHLRVVIALAALIVATRAIALPPPMLYRAIVDQALPSGDATQLVHLIGWLAAVLLGARVIGLGLNIIAVKLQQGVLHDVRMALYRHLQRLDLGFFRKHHTGGLLSRIVSDVSRVQTVLSRETFEVLASVLQVAVVAAILIALDGELTAISALVFPVLVGLVALFQKAMYRISKRMQERQESLSARLSEDLSGTRLIQALAIERARIEETEETSASLRNTIVRSHIIGHSVNLLAITLTDIPLTLFVWGYGGYKVLHGEMTLGTLLAFHQYLMMVYQPVMRIFRFGMELQSARAALDRIFEVFDTTPAVADEPDARPLQIEKGAIELCDVTLGYEANGEPAVRDLSISIAPGEVLGLVGPSGAGKTTVVNGLMRFLEPRSGSIRIDGQDLRQVTLESLRRQIGLVSQEVFLFTDTIANNIALAADGADREAIEAAARAAHAHEYISQLDRGYDTEVGERGLGLSGGEQQRLALARTILRDPPIFIFDEATSALDAHSEAAIQEALAEVVKDRTTIIIAHRFSTLKLCDRIAVIANGQLLELGTHAELTARGGLYRALLETQLTGPGAETPRLEGTRP